MPTNLVLMTFSHDYSLFFKFIEKYSPAGFSEIDPADPLMIEFEAMMEKNKQFFYIADPIRLKILYTSKQCLPMLGIESAELNFSHFMEAIHPDDIQRLSLGRAKVIKMAQDLYIAEKGYTYLSTNFKFRNSAGKYSNLLIQSYLYYTPVPGKTVFYLKVHTNIDWYRKINHHYHYYYGDDLSYFRYPDEALLSAGNVFSHREFEIISLVESGLSTAQIAEKLYLSPFTVNTHRRNILKKTDKTQLSELIYELKEKGVL